MKKIGIILGAVLLLIIAFQLNKNEALDSNTTTKDLEDHDKTFYSQTEDTIVDVLYATDRGLDAKAELEERYTIERSELKYGVTQVSVPKTHTFGWVERPSNFLIFKGKEKIGHHVVITKLEALELEKFREILSLKLSNVDESDILIFVHGFNVTFAESIRQTAQIAYDLHFLGVPLTYSWPSQGNPKLTKYMTDEESVKYTNSHLVTFLKEVIAHKGNANIHILAHSMGTRAVANAVKEIALTHDTPQFKNVILAAPDIDADVFKVNLYPYLKKATEKITIYASSTDKALGISKMLHGWKKRLGSGGENITVLNDIVMVDATGIDTSFLGHSYFAEKEILVNDLRAVVQKSLPPQQRPNLLERIKHKMFYWKFDIPEVKNTVDNLELLKADDEDDF